MFDDIVKLSVNGLKYSGWKTMDISRTMETLSSAFAISACDIQDQKDNSNWLIQTQEQCNVYIGSDLLLTGYIDDFEAELSSDLHTLSLAGRSLTSDLVDCNYIDKPLSFNNQTLLSLTKRLVKPFGINVKVVGDVDVSTTFPFVVNANQSVFKNLSKKAKDFGVLLLSDAKGNLIITNSGSSIYTDTLVMGENVKKAAVRFDYTERYSTYIVQAQSLAKQGKGAWKTHINIKAESKDEGIRRYRPKLIKSPTPLSRKMIQDTANWEALVRAGKSQVVTCELPGFRNSKGELWDINHLVSVYIPELYINPSLQMLITGVDFSLDSEGSKTTLTLKRKDSYASKPARKKSVKALQNLGWDKLKRKNRK